MIDVLILNDNQFRDLFSQKLLAEYLNKKNLRVKIVSKIIYRTAIDYLNPQLVVVPRITDDFEEIFKLKKKKNFKLIFIPCEHGAALETRILSFIKSYSFKDVENKDYKENLKLIDKIFVPSEFYKITLIKHNLFDENQISVSGTINSDLWFKNLNSVFKKENYKKTIGIATSFKSFMFTSNYESIQKAIYTINDFPKKGKVTFESQKEDLFFLLNEMYQFMVLSKIISDNKNINFSIRVHPGENIKNINYFKKKTSNVLIDRNLILQEWISRQKIILAFSSTLIFDSYFSNVPTYSLSKLVPNDIVGLLEEVKKPLNTDFLYQPENFKDLYEKINSKDEEYNKSYLESLEIKINSISTKNFNFPRKKVAFQLIGDEILNLINIRKRSIFKEFLFYFSTIIIHLKQIKAANLLFKYKFVVSDKVFNPLNILENKKIKKIVKLIVKKLKD